MPRCWGGWQWTRVRGFRARCRRFARERGMRRGRRLRFLGYGEALAVAGAIRVPATSTHGIPCKNDRVGTEAGALVVADMTVSLLPPHSASDTWRERPREMDR